jgi:Domain of unknown function (DUF4956)
MAEKFYDLTNPNFLSFMSRFAINIVFLFILIKLIYFKYSKKEEFLFYFSVMGVTAFFITAILNSVPIEMGMAVGLFALFGIMRLRSINFRAKDMAYTFATLAVSFINSFKLLKFPLLGILIINGIILLTVYLLEEYLAKNKFEGQTTIYYDKLELLKPEKKDKLLKDISERTGKKVYNVTINEISFKYGRALLDIYYKE